MAAVGGHPTPGIWDYLFDSEKAFKNAGVSDDKLRPAFGTLRFVSFCVGFAATIYTVTCLFLQILSSLALVSLGLFSLSMFVGSYTGDIGFVLLPILAYIAIKLACSSPMLFIHFSHAR